MKRMEVLTLILLIMALMVAGTMDYNDEIASEHIRFTYQVDTDSHGESQLVVTLANR